MGLTVLSCFDGISCGRLALERSGIVIDKYYASEIDRHAIKVAMKNYPDTVQVGDIRNVRGSDFRKVDLFIGGSPCQSFSFSGKMRGMVTSCNIEITSLEEYLRLKEDDFEFEGQSYLFWEYVRLRGELMEVNPDLIFLLENVRMTKAWEVVINNALGVEPILIDSSLVSAQSRKRLYWFGQIRERMYHNEFFCYICNKKNNEQKEKQGILGETQGAGTESVLGETQNGHVCMYSVQQGVLEDRKKGNDENLLERLPKGKHETVGAQQISQELRGAKGISKGISQEESGENTGVPKTIQKNADRKETLKENGRQSREKNCKINEESSFEANIWTKNKVDERGVDGLVGDENDVCCVSCGKGLNYRPQNSIISWGNERFGQFASIVSRMQFEEARQDNGRVFDIFKIGFPVESLFGESIEEIPQPADRKIFLRDILEDEVDEKYRVTNIALNRIKKRLYSNARLMPDKTGTISTKNNSGQMSTDSGTTLVPCVVASRGREVDGKWVQQLEANYDGKTNCLTSVQKDNMVLQLSDCVRSGGVQPYQQDRVYDVSGKSPNLDQDGRKNIYDGMIIRRLTEVECERLQGLPDNFTEGISSTQRYKCIGNGWQVDTVAWIFGHMDLPCDEL